MIILIASSIYIYTSVNKECLGKRGTPNVYRQYTQKNRTKNTERQLQKNYLKKPKLSTVKAI